MRGHGIFSSRNRDSIARVERFQAARRRPAILVQQVALGGQEDDRRLGRLAADEGEPIVEAVVRGRARGVEDEEVEIALAREEEAVGGVEPGLAAEVPGAQTHVDRLALSIEGDAKGERSHLDVVGHVVVFIVIEHAVLMQTQQAGPNVGLAVGPVPQRDQPGLVERPFTLANVAKTGLRVARF